MKTLAPPDIHHLRAAQGWLGLGNYEEARHELEQVSPQHALHSEVLETRWEIYAKAQNWQACVDVATALVELDPKLVSGWIHRSYALHEMQRTQEAANSLLPAVERFPKDWLIRYNLACYSCQLGDFVETRNWLLQAFDLGDAKKIRQMALEDPDLKDFFSKGGEL